MRRDFLLFALGRPLGQSVNRPLVPLISGDGAHPRRLSRRSARLSVASPIARLTVADRGANPPTSPTLRINKFLCSSRPLLVRYLRADGKHIGAGKLEAQ